MTPYNYTLLCDFYELTMANGYFVCGKGDEISYFDVFFRRIPDGGGYAIAAGLEQVIDYISNLHFTEEDIDFLRTKNQFSEDFLAYLRTFRFTGDIWAVPEGTPIFPGEPILTVRARAVEAQFIETFLLLALNHQSLIATKASRVVRAAQGRAVAEFGSRRAQGADGAILGARAAYIGGCSATACTISDRMHDIPAIGTMAHSWVQMFDTEYEAFRTYCELYPNNATLLVDTYDVLRSGVPNAIRAFKEVLLPQGSEQTSAKPLARITIDAEGNYFASWGKDKDRHIQEEEIVPFLLDCSAKDSTMYVALYADESVPYASVVKVLNVANENKFKMVLATRRPDKE